MGFGEILGVVLLVVFGALIGRHFFQKKDKEAPSGDKGGGASGPKPK